MNVLHNFPLPPRCQPASHYCNSNCFLNPTVTWMSCSIPITLPWLQHSHKAYKSCSMAHNHTHTCACTHTLSCNRAYWESGWLLFTQGEFREATSILSSKINMLVSLCLFVSFALFLCVCLFVCVHGLGCLCEMRFTFWTERGFTGVWVDRSMLSGRHTLSRARIALERPQQSVLAGPVP